MRLDKAMMVKRENIENIEKKIALLFKILYIRMYLLELILSCIKVFLWIILQP